MADDYLTRGDRKAIDFYAGQAEKAAAAGDLHGVKRNKTQVARIDKQARDRAAEGIQVGDSDGYVEVRGGTGLCLLHLLLRLAALPVILAWRGVRRR